MLEEAFCAVVFPVHAVQADSFQFTLHLSFRDAAAAVGVFQRVRYRKRFTHDRASYARAAYHCGRSARASDEVAVAFFQIATWRRIEHFPFCTPFATPKVGMG